MVRTDFSVKTITKDDKGKTFYGRIMFNYGRNSKDCSKLKEYQILRVNKKTATIIIDGNEEKIELDLSRQQWPRHEMWRSMEDYHLGVAVSNILKTINNSQTELTREQAFNIAKELNISVGQN
ncbi:conserved hypothetical protein [Vibrio chagasii]|uniref:hypothetical protein n=1 Tax=Vibrio fortis TaxID=212667 RepID=UPI0033824ACD|nr:conserved hypothetical protein [Vibrio chagasii]CAH7365444.1 conserved hypothetical protein [Vibrio chagasii]